MSFSQTNLNTLIHTLIPESRSDPALAQEISEHANELLRSHIGTEHEPDIGYLSDLIRRQLLQRSPSGTASLKFTNLLSRFLDQSVLSRKQACVQFLYSLASSSTSTKIPDNMFLPSLVPPPPKVPLHAGHTEGPGSSALPKTRTAADIYDEYRNVCSQSYLPESLLLRDALYLLQGISGKYVRLIKSDDPRTPAQLKFIGDPQYMISGPTRALLHRISEVGYLYMRVERFMSEKEQRSSVGMIEQSLCHHLQEQLTEYYRLIAVLEAQMKDSDESLNGLREQETGLTLRRLDVWITDWRLRMRMMSVCVQGAQDANGGALVNLIHSYTNNGDPFVRKFTDQLLENVSKPFFAILHQWLFSGELHDPFSEFFVEADPALAHVQYLVPASERTSIGDEEDGLPADVVEREGGLKLWQNKYRFRSDMLPTFLGEFFGKKIFSTGKSLNFIRYSCHDSDWVATRKKMLSSGRVLKYSDIAGLERSIDDAYVVASRRLFEVFLEKFKLLDHLRAMKHYLLLGHGDFTEQLMETLGPSLSRPANTLYRHNLTATLETAIRTSNAQNDPPDVLRRLDARMLEYSQGEIGWDVFTLEYKVDAPIDTVVDPDTMLQYLKVFNHLWQMKRVSSALGSGWMRLAGASRTFSRLPDLQYDWHQIRISMAEMIHFIRQMEAYCHLEVIECQWKILTHFLGKQEGDLDALLEAHQTYLNRIVKQVLLLSSKTGKEETLLIQVREIFAIILEFREAVEHFYNYCLSESSRRDHDQDALRGVYSSSSSSDDDAEKLRLIRQRSQEYRVSFSERATTIIHGLQSHSDLTCRSLAIKLSFSEYYKTRRETQSRSQ